MEASWTLLNLAAAVASALATGYEGPPNSRVRDVPDARTIRYYTTLGLIDPPAELRGRTALYTERHLFQLVAIKRLQARGAPLAEIQRRLTGLPTPALRRLAAIPGSASKRSEPKTEPRRFWREVAEPPSSPAASEVSTTAATAMAGVSLGNGVTILIQTRETIDDRAAAAIRQAAQPLIDLLSAIGITPTEKEDS